MTVSTGREISSGLLCFLSHEDFSNASRTDARAVLNIKLQARLPSNARCKDNISIKLYLPILRTIDGSVHAGVFPLQTVWENRAFPFPRLTNHNFSSLPQRLDVLITTSLSKVIRHSCNVGEELRILSDNVTVYWKHFIHPVSGPSFADIKKRRILITWLFSWLLRGR